MLRVGILLLVCGQITVEALSVEALAVEVDRPDRPSPKHLKHRNTHRSRRLSSTVKKLGAGEGSSNKTVEGSSNKIVEGSSNTTKGSHRELYHDNLGLMCPTYDDEGELIVGRPPWQSCNCASDCVEYPNTKCSCDAAFLCCDESGYDEAYYNFGYVTCPGVRSRENRRSLRDFPGPPPENVLCHCDMRDCMDGRNSDEYCFCDEAENCCMHFFTGFLTGWLLQDTCERRREFHYHYHENGEPVPTFGFLSHVLEHDEPEDGSLTCEDYAYSQIYDPVDVNAEPLEVWDVPHINCIEDGAFAFCRECGACVRKQGGEKCANRCHHPRFNYQTWYDKCDNKKCWGCYECMGEIGFTPEMVYQELTDEGEGFFPGAKRSGKSQGATGSTNQPPAINPKFLQRLRQARDEL